MPVACVREIVELYLSQAKYSDQSREVRMRFLEPFMRDFGERAVASCTPGDLALWIHRHKAWKSPWTIRTVARFVNRPFNWANGLRLIDANPFASVTFEEGEPRRPMTNAEFWLIYRHASDGRFRRVLLFLRWTGARPGEMARATWLDVDWVRAAIILAEHKSRRKTRKPRVIPLSDRCLKMLAWMRRQVEGDGLIFVSQRGKAWTSANIARRLENLKLRHGLAKDCVLYGTRHAFGTNGVLRGANLMLISKAMGHSSISITERYYVHIDREIDAIRAATTIAGK